MTSTEKDVVEAAVVVRKAQIALSECPYSDDQWPAKNGVVYLAERYLEKCIDQLIEKRNNTLDPKPKESRSCNMHTDCNAADELSKQKYNRKATHCHDEDCDDCFGS